MNVQFEKTVLLTGAAGGIGYETAKAFADMGARVLMIDIDKEKGEEAAKSLNRSHSGGTAVFYPTDLSQQAEVSKLCDRIISEFGCPDVVFNNATWVPLGTIEEIGIGVWDRSYAVNLKAPMMLAAYFLPHMKKRNTGSFVFVSSSGAAPYMGAYEIFKTAQVELSNTLAMELEHTNVTAYTIGPGLVKTETAEKSIGIVASKMNMSVEEFYQMNAAHIIKAEDAGMGFALSVLKAENYHGQELSSIQVLNDFNFYQQSKQDINCRFADRELLLRIITTYQEQYQAWQGMNLFERQWVLRDFKKTMGMPADKVSDSLQKLSERPEQSTEIGEESRTLFEKLKTYWERQFRLLQGYEKNQSKLVENSRSITSWIKDITTLLESLH